jgi:phosphatidyl-myo-inositol dimannoside synthase
MGPNHPHASPAGHAPPAASGRPRARLLMLTPDFPPSHGGVQSLVYGLAGAMDGFEIEVVTLDSPGAELFDARSAVVTHRSGGAQARKRARLLALNFAGLRHALAFRPRLTLSAHVMVSPAAAAIRGALGARTAQYFHAVEIPGRPRLSAFAAARADLSIAVSAHTASLVAQTGASLTNVNVIPPGVELPRDASPIDTERPIVLTIAALKFAYKGHDVLIDALARVREAVPDVEWVVIGDGPLRARLEALARARGLAGIVRFLGAVSDAERELWLRRAALAAMPSRSHGEGFGIAYLEAGAYGKPVVAGNLAGAPEAVADGVSGVLVDPLDACAVAEAIERLLLDRELALRLGRGGAEVARSHAWPVIASRVEAALLELAASRP